MESLTLGIGLRALTRKPGMIRKLVVVLILSVWSLDSFGADQDEQKERDLPPIVKHSYGGEFYPPNLREKGVTGFVIMGFKIDKAGAVVDLRKVSAEVEDFVVPSALFLRAFKFRVPENWESSGEADRQYVVKVSFLLRRDTGSKCRESQAEAKDKRITFQVCALEQARGRRSLQD